MKDDFGASMVRVYAPECRELSVWEALVRACAENDIGLIVMASLLANFARRVLMECPDGDQVWWGFNEDVSTEVRGGGVAADPTTAISLPEDAAGSV